MAPTTYPIKSRVFHSNAHRPTHFKCRVCVDKYHPLKNCFKFIAMNAMERKRIAIEHKYCLNCFAHEHPNRKTCPSNSCCRICKRKHHTMLHHPQRKDSHQKSTKSHTPTVSKSSSSKPSSSKSSISRSSNSKPAQRESSPAHVSLLTTFLSAGVVSLLPTAVVNLIIDGKTRAVRALLDQCCPFSRVSSSLIEDLKIKTFSVAGYSVVTLLLQSRCTDQAKIEGQFRVGNRLSMTTPFRSMDKRIKANFPHMFLADVEFYRSRSIAIVIGSEMFGKVLQEGMMQRGGLVAQNTIFGWAISGKYGE